MKLKINPSIEHHTLVAIVIALWAFLFGILGRPFEHGYMDLKIWLKVSTLFSVSFFITYFILAVIQNRLYQVIQRWNILYEVLMYLLLHTTYIALTYFLYRSTLIKGIYDFSEYFFKISINIIFIVTPIIIIARKYTIKLLNKTKEEKITIKGDNKLDIFIIKPSDLICISNAQNYVEIFYLEKDELHSKLIRSSLKKILNDFNFLMQIHRSHLINPYHFKSWKDSNTITLSKIDLPVSKSYKNNLLDL
ncbi:histidine kinase [Tenacibaculum sp. SZ-18]|uniref:LytTR family DNA-binding domain-containing protein n=1 Tax=Tenacibaculum sp. SZ-18 TaxID=754423 RepID=UPI000C2D1E54|nr:LytTR family DNA-binding domain-containing protein [Tenacibaculum sp. SZ-18]AUC14217.1 histidine kinase [Tenacibaculum sp. SZ-18]